MMRHIEPSMADDPVVICGIFKIIRDIIQRVSSASLSHKTWHPGYRYGAWHW